MKKIMLTAAALCAAVGFADIQSANIVGYQSITIDKEITAIGISFQNVAGGEIDIQDAFPYVEGMTKGKTTGTADKIMIWNGSGYSTYYLSNGRNAKDKVVEGLEGKWAPDGKTTVAKVSLGTGTAVWYYSKNSTTPYSITVAGQVLNSTNCALPIEQGITFIANPYPTDLPLNDGIPYVEGMTKGKTTGTADKIMIWNGSGYSTYYLSNGRNAKDKVVEGLEGKWAPDGKTTPTIDCIPAGKGAWYYKKNDNTAFNITVARPF